MVLRLAVAERLIKTPPIDKVFIYSLTPTSILPVSVLISHLPPVIDFGTLTLPVSESAKKILSVRSSPVTLPVSVSM